MERNGCQQLLELLEGQEGDKIRGEGGGVKVGEK